MKVQIPLKQLSDHQINTYLSISLKITYIYLLKMRSKHHGKKLAL